MNPIFFANQANFRSWLEKNHLSENELFVGFYKVNSGIPSMTWSESVDQALCFGWIDGVKRTIDENSYQIRFTPRKKNSIWSAVNIKKVESLFEQGLMMEAGLEVFQQRKQEYLVGYGSKDPELSLSAKFEQLFKSNATAWNYFQLLAPTYRKTSLNWVMGAKQEITQLKRLNELIADSENGTNKWKDNKYGKK